MDAVAERLHTIYGRMNEHFGDLQWWPGDTPFEMAVGAILTQNTSWQNVERAIARLKEEGLLSPEGLFHLHESDLAALIRPSGYYHVKAKRLKSFLSFLMGTYNGSMDDMFRQDLWPLREQLLQVHGIGEETADSILLYGGRKAIFVVDAYTRRILTRARIIDNDCTYGTIQELFMDNLPRDHRLYNQYHALLVHTGKHYCRPTPRCAGCPLRYSDGTGTH